ncbi:MAG: amidohydrolase family protein [Planctomycetaceae bacterium]|nr:amidohydrolase family protein [Planctomycetaceae bacterium]
MNVQDSSRRDFLKASASAATAFGLTSSVIPELSMAEDCTTTNEYPWIDAHSHIWTRDVKRYPLANGMTLDDLDPPSFTTEELLDVAHKNGVGKVVLIAHNQFYRWDNSYMIDAVKQHPHTFRIVGMVDNMAPHPDIAMKKLLAQKVTGFRITPGVYGRDKWLENPGMHAMWKMAAQTRQNMCCLINPEDLPTIDVWCEKYPETPVVIDHFARIGIDGKMRKSDLDHLCKLARHRYVTVKISAYYALGNKKPPHTELIPMIERLIDAFGVERLMWASDSPYQLVGENTYSDSIKLITERMKSLSADDREWLLRKTAERVFFFV